MNLFCLARLLFLLSLTSSLWICILSAATITHLPGFNCALPFHLETGYVRLDEVTEADLFYYFVESERNPREDPLILWLTGGPGCTSFFAMCREIGPIRFKIAPYNGSLPTLVYNPYAWTKISNIIFLDWPALSGFSFLRNVEEYNGDDIRSLKEIYNFLRKWFLDHPLFLSNPFYVGGNSYGGKMVPIVAYRVAEGIEAGQQPIINLKGFISGNPISSTVIDINARVPYAHRKGIISDELVQAIQKSCPGEDYKKPTTAPCIEQIKIFRGVSIITLTKSLLVSMCFSNWSVVQFMNELMMDNYLTPKCEGESGRPETVNAAEADRCTTKLNPTELRSPPPVPDIKCTTYGSYLAYHWANRNDTRVALHVKEGTVKEWQICNDDFNYERQLIHSSIPYHHALISRGYRSLVFSGDHDLVVPYSGTMEWIDSLNLSVIEPWRSWHVNGQVGGYTVRYSNNLTFATVKGGGHEPSKDRNVETFAIFYRWISDKAL